MDVKRLFERHYAGLVRFLYARLGDRDQAEDLAQEAFVRLLDRPPREPEGWLYIVAANLARDASRGELRRARHLHVLSHDRAADADAVPSADQAMLREEDAALVRCALAMLSERDRTILVLKSGGRSYREMAGVIGVSPTSIGPLLLRAQRRLVRALSRANEPGGGSERHTGEAV